MAFRNLKSLPKYKLISVIRDIEKSIKKKCYDCMGGHKKTDCLSKDCLLFKFRPWSNNEDLENYLRH